MEPVAVVTAIGGMATRLRSRKKLLIGGSIALLIIVIAIITRNSSGEKRTTVQTDVAITYTARHRDSLPQLIDSLSTSDHVH